MTAQIEPNPREGRELSSTASKLWQVVSLCACFAGLWLWRRRHGIAMLIVYGLLYALTLALTYREPKLAGLVAFLAAAGAIIGHCIDQASSPGAHL